YEALPTPTTPKPGEDLARLLAMIEHVPKEPSDEARNQHKERLQQKVSHAVQTFLAKNALLRDHNKLLTKINDESKTRRATKSTILGKARVMTWEDLENGRRERTEKEEKKAAKEAREAITGKKRGRARTSSSADTLEPKAKVARRSDTVTVNTQNAEAEAGPSEPRAKVVKKSKAQGAEASPLKLKANVVRSKMQVAEGKAHPLKSKDAVHMVPQVKKIKVVPKPWKAPEARMF
ncbi:hypothetical protein EJ02DRAFT_362433, partial [Clathrospora elynae]